MGVAVLGAGAIGSCVGADLAGAGIDVVLVDQWPAHVEAMRSAGLRVLRPEGEVTLPVEALHLCDLASAGRTFDVVLLAAKSQDTRWLASLAEPYLRPGGAVVGMQNGMNDETIAGVVGAERVVGCVVELSAEVFTPGVVQRNTARAGTWFALGELDGQRTARLEALAQLLGHAGRVDLTTNIEGAKWTKLVNSAMILAPFGCLGLQSYQAVQMPDVVALCARLGGEALRVGAACGYRVEAIFGRSADEFDLPDDQLVDLLLHALLDDLGQGARRARGAVLQDFLKGRRSEAPFLSGVVSRRGREVGIPTPANDAVVEVSRRIDALQLRPDPANLALLEDLAGAGEPS
jgi:2-dehydropantoate 2-reductase